MHSDVHEETNADLQWVKWHLVQPFHSDSLQAAAPSRMFPFSAGLSSSLTGKSEAATRHPCIDFPAHIRIASFCSLSTTDLMSVSLSFCMCMHV